MEGVPRAVAQAAEQAHPVLCEHAASVDRTADFPVASLTALRRPELLGLLVPQRFGGVGGGPPVLLAVARRLAGACMSSALIWSMHCQQVAVLDRFGGPELAAELLSEVAAGKLYLASVTTERRRGADLVEVDAALQWSDDGVKLHRAAPVVTGGGHADAFLITMRRDPSRDRGDVVLVAARREQLTVQHGGTWDTMGVRGTASVPLELAGTLPRRQVIDPLGGFPRVARVAMVPFGHLAWAACWLGAAEGIVREVVAYARNPATRNRLGALDELFHTRLGRVRGHVDIAEALLERYARELDELWRSGDEAGFDDVRFRLRANNVKVAVSEAAFAAVGALQQLVGLRLGYSRSSPVPVERVYRDLRSASLMVPNERLLAIMGRLALFERGQSAGPRGGDRGVPG